MSILYLNPSAFKSPNLFNHSSVLALIGSCQDLQYNYKDYMALVAKPSSLTCSSLTTNAAALSHYVPAQSFVLMSNQSSIHLVSIAGLLIKLVKLLREINVIE
jgi:hypothetical protein